MVSISIFLDDLLVDSSGLAHLRSHTVWGILRGLESFTHLVYKTKESGYLVSYREKRIITITICIIPIAIKNDMNNFNSVIVSDKYNVRPR